MTADQIVTAFLILIALGLVIGGPIWIWRRSLRINAAQEAEARAFEREMLSTAPRPANRDHAAPGPSAGPSPVRTVGRALPAFGEDPGPPAASVAEETPVAPTPAEPGPVATTPSVEGPSPLVQSVIEKLEIAGTFKSVEGPLRCANPEIKGTLLSLKGGRRVGVVEAGFDRSDPALQGLLRHMDGLLVAGADEELLYFKRFQDFLSDLIAL